MKRLEISEAYIGKSEASARVMIHRLTNNQTQTRLKNQAIREKKKGIVMKDKSKRLMGMNVYITNTSLKKKSLQHQFLQPFVALKATKTP